MKEFTYAIKDPNGIHARPAGELVKLLHGFESAVTVSGGVGSCDGKKLIALMKLRVKCGDAITVKAEGADEEAAVEAARAFVEHNL
ncbi:MAG: HPr family phosphocarrier protein [Spirochaetaceae bacterium]|jgi:phosphotransferase system HPr (HPr) family protein|nr:HPr family phosphocarrier protein [Spirochaetaceae bacterium]